MDLADPCSFSAAVDRLETPEKAAGAVLPLLETGLLSYLHAYPWLSQTRALPVE